MTFLQGRVGCLWIVSCSIVSMNPAEMISKQMPGGERVGEILPGGDHRKKKKKKKTDSDSTSILDKQF